VPTPVAVRRCLSTLLAGCLPLLLVLATAAPADAALGQRTLAQGKRGADVRALQQLLRQAGFPQRIDGVFGRGTYRTLRRLERELGLRVDGRFTRGDLARVRRALAPSDGTGGFSMADASEAERRPRAVSSQEAPGAKAQLTEDGLAIPPADAPEAVKKVIAAANKIAHKPYRYGGGHGRWEDSGYDCSGSVSYALHGGGLLDASMPSGGFTSWGEAGAGKWITTYANGGHMYMVVAGLRFDTSGRSKTGSRWQKDLRSPSGFTVRHPEGL
jgi:peptidoglycan hydrolase-like protein with peptidoglycan-binding domain